MPEFCVITEVPPRNHAGNLAALMEVVYEKEQMSPENEWEGVYLDLHEVDPNLAMLALMKLRVPVFRLGEIIVCDENGREIGGAGRKPSKWLISFEVYNSVFEAVQRSKEVLA